VPGRNDFGPGVPDWSLALQATSFAILAHANYFHLSVLLGQHDFGAGVSNWALGLGVAVTGVWGVTLTIATLTYLRDARRGR